MADFEKSFARLMKDEGIVLTDSVGDKGGQTFCGISRKFHPDWIGWKDIDANSTPSMDLVRGFYRENFWEPIKAEQIKSQRVAEVLFSQYVNMGANGIKLMQTSLGLIADGQVGSKTLNALNTACESYIVSPEEAVLLVYQAANTTRYHAIGMKDKTQRKWWPGWFRRSIEILKESK